MIIKTLKSISTIIFLMMLPRDAPKRQNTYFGNHSFFLVKPQWRMEVALNDIAVVASTIILLGSASQIERKRRRKKRSVWVKEWLMERDHRLRNYTTSWPAFLVVRIFHFTLVEFLHSRQITVAKRSSR